MMLFETPDEIFLKGGEKVVRAYEYKGEDAIITRIDAFFLHSEKERIFVRWAGCRPIPDLSIPETSDFPQGPLSDIALLGIYPPLHLLRDAYFVVAFHSHIYRAVRFTWNAYGRLLSESSV